LFVEIISQLFTHTTLLARVFARATCLSVWCQISSQNSKGVTPSGSVKQGRGGQNQQFSLWAWLSRKQ